MPNDMPNDGVDDAPTPEELADPAYAEPACDPDDQDVVDASLELIPGRDFDPDDDPDYEGEDPAPPEPDPDPDAELPIPGEHEDPVEGDDDV